MMNSYFSAAEENLKSRRTKTVINNITDNHNAKGMILTSPSDLGVCRNGGRRGAKYAPEAIWSVLKKMAVHNDFPLGTSEVSDALLEIKDFDKAQIKSTEKIKKVLELKSFKKLVHIGGGHDHIYPLLNALNGKRLKILNIDAHCDTRVDTIAHSGTPFRQFDQVAMSSFALHQLAIHPYSNAKATLKSLNKGRMDITYTSDLKKHASLTQWASKHLKFDGDEFFILSLDCDAINASQMQAVSSVNPNGVFVEDLLELIKMLKEKIHAFGIYEYNPVYDDLSQKGAKAIAAMIYEYLFE